ncbi:MULTISPECIES: antitermination protein NusB [unclassified Microbulbifer]|uniref:antitermination protein NusB n=1 Tax=unclassified Microbulbifer TaxID=2619833 RepID=UPI0027E3DA10|nr:MULTISPECIES: antitermination protein NusB [unclassified Microbulbifer]
MEDNLIQVGGQYFVGWGTLALINCVLAQGKNRSGLLWFIISLFIGPIATFLLAVLEKPKEK